MMYYARAIRFYRNVSGDEMIQVLMSDGVIENYKNDARGRKAAFKNAAFNTSYFDEREPNYTTWDKICHFYCDLPKK